MTLFHALGPFAAQAGVVAAPGMVLLTPTSIAHSGTSASIGANGQVTFTAVTSLSLNGVFSVDFDNYVVSLRIVGSTDVLIQCRFRASGTDASGSDYTRQELNASSTTVSANRTTSTQGILGVASFEQRDGHTFSIYGPHLAQPTAIRSVTVDGRAGARINDYAVTHSLSTSYDGFTLFPNTGNFTGALTVMGVRS